MYYKLASNLTTLIQEINEFYVRSIAKQM